MSNQKRVIIIGNGPNGIAIAHALVNEGGVDPSDILIVDNKGPMEQFGHHVANIGMTNMRSPWDVSVVRSRESLERFSEALDSPSRGDGWRPSWETFKHHAVSVLSALQLPTLHDRVTHATPTARNTWEIKTGEGATLLTDNLIVATGLAPHRVQPFEHATALPEQPLLPKGGRIAIVGGGMTATNAAITLLSREDQANGTEVTLFSPHGMEHEEGLGPWLSGALRDDACNSAGAEEARESFLKLDIEDRLSFLMGHRIDGTINIGHLSELSDDSMRGRFFVEEVRVTKILARRYGRFMVITRKNTYPNFDAVYDARGYHPNLDNLRSITGLVEAVGDRRYEQYPLIDDTTGATLPGLYFAGALSALSFGPAASTVAGGTMLGHVIARDLLRNRN